MKKIIRIIGGQGLVLAIVAGIIIFSSYWAVSNVSAQRNEDVVKSLEEALQRASVQCYALEGAYPPDLEYLRENYGIILDEETYFYLYDLQEIGRAHV